MLTTKKTQEFRITHPLWSGELYHEYFLAVKHLDCNMMSIEHWFIGRVDDKSGLIETTFRRNKPVSNPIMINFTEA